MADEKDRWTFNDGRVLTFSPTFGADIAGGEATSGEIMAAAAMMIRLDDQPLEPVRWLNLADQAPESRQDELHPTGRCTCGGEGRCEWCHRACEACQGDCYETPCEVCGSTGYRPEADYEALGYQETEAYETELESAANVARYFHLTVDILAFEHWRR